MPKIATTQFSIDPIKSSVEFWYRVELLLHSAKTSKAEAILFPEYFSLSLATVNPYSGSFRERLLQLAKNNRPFIDQMCKLAKKYRITIIAGTIPVSMGKKILNRAYIFQSNGKVIQQDKMMMTRFEKEEWKISSGAKQVRTFQIGKAKCAVLTCYDIEFPALSRITAQKKVDIIFVPSCTDDRNGYWRVRHCAQARAIENQCYIIMSALIGGNPLYTEIAEHYGRGGIFSPCDTRFPERGLMAEGSFFQEGICISELSLPDLFFTRKSGTVLNLKDSE